MGHRKRDHYFNMRNNIDTQPLAADLGRRFRPVFSSYDGKFKRMEDDEEVGVVQEEEYIDVIGEYPASEPEPEVVHPKAQSLLLEQPPSKIYYDNIEKESSDGGFFDRDDLEDEDERNELVIDCKLLNGGAGGTTEDPQPPQLKKKTDLRICEPPTVPQNGQKFIFPPATTPSTTSSTTSPEEPEVVFNFTLVDTQLVYNESKLVSPKDPTTPVISVHIPAAAAQPPRPSMLQQQLQNQQQQQHHHQNHQRISSQLRNLKELRTRPYGGRTPPRMMPNDPRRMSRSYRMAVSNSGGGCAVVQSPVKRVLQQRLIGGRLAGEHVSGSGRVR